MKKKLVILSVLSVASVMALTGCRGVETGNTKTTLSESATTTVTAKDGTVTVTVLPKGTVIDTFKRTASESLLTDQALAGAGSVQAAKVIPTGDSSTPMCEVILGGGNNAFGKAPTDSNQCVFAYSKSMSIWGSITSASASGLSYIYIGAKGESADDTTKRITAMLKLANANAVQ